MSVKTAEQISQLIPHGPTMVLIDTVERWDEHQIVATSRSHRRPDNPLLENGKLGGACLLEYGAQAAAIHAGLNAERFTSSKRAAYVAAVKNVQLFVESVDKDIDTLLCRASLETGNVDGAIYSIAVTNKKKDDNNGEASLLTALIVLAIQP